MTIIYSGWTETAEEAAARWEARKARQARAEMDAEIEKASRYVAEQIIYRETNTFPIDADLQAMPNPVELEYMREHADYMADKQQEDELRGGL